MGIHYRRILCAIVQTAAGESYRGVLKGLLREIIEV